MTITESRNDVKVAHFVCGKCDVLITIPERLFLSGGYTTNCKNCGNLVSVHMASSDEGMEILELSGCQYTSKTLRERAEEVAKSELQRNVDDWITDSVQEEEFPEDERDQEESLIDGGSFVDALLNNKWEVYRQNGEVFQFEYFSMLRQWIEEGKITSGDEIVPSGGKRYPVDTYPGTADLFGNPKEIPSLHSLSKSQNRFSAIRKKNLLQSILLIGITVVLAATIAFTPKALRLWHQRQGEKFVKDLIENLSSRDSRNTPELVSNAKELLRIHSIEMLPKASSTFLEVLARNPKDPEILSYLADTWIEIGALTGDAKEFQNAEKLIQYAQALYPDHPLVNRALARLYWRTGELEKGIHILEGFENMAPETRALLAKMLIEKGDFTKATLHLSEALKSDPKNIRYLTALVDLFEQQSKYSEAASYLQRIRELAENPAPYTLRLKTLYRSSNDLDSLEVLYRSLIASKTNVEENKYELIRLLHSQKRKSQVVKEALIYFEEFPAGAHFPEIRNMYDSSIEQPSDSTSKESINKKRKRRLRRFRRRR